eukprot:IDg5934t1
MFCTHLRQRCRAARTLNIGHVPKSTLCVRKSIHLPDPTDASRRLSVTPKAYRCALRPGTGMDDVSPLYPLSCTCDVGKACITQSASLPFNVVFLIICRQIASSTILHRAAQPLPSPTTAWMKLEKTA